MTYCLERDLKKAEYYFIRSRAYYYAQKYELALKDSENASFLEPEKMSHFVEKLKILSRYPKALSLLKVLQTLPEKIKFESSISIDLFAPHFEKLRKQYFLLQDLNKSGITYTQEHFNHYYKNLFVSPKGIQESVIAIIASMKPHKKVYKRIKKEVNILKGKHLKIIGKVLKLIEKKMKEQKRLTLLSKLTRKDFLKNIPQTYWKKHYDLLIKIVLDKEGTLAIGDKTTWNYMRYNAARVLSNIEGVREKLINDFIFQAKYNMSSRIFFAEAFYKQGFVYFAKQFIIETIKKSQDEFIKVIAIKALTPSCNQHKNILVELLRDTSERVRVTAASRFVIHKTKHVKKIIEVFLEGSKSKDEYIRALSVQLLWGDRLFSSNTYKKISYMKQFYPSYLKSLDDTSDLVKLVAYTNVKVIRNEYKFDIQKIKNRLQSSFLKVASPLIRYHSISVMSSISSQEMFNTIALNKEAPLVERFAAIIGFVNLKGGDNIGYGILTSIIDKALTEEEPIVRGFILYMLSLTFERSKQLRYNRFTASLFFNALKRYFVRDLRGKKVFPKVITLLLLINTQHIPDFIVEEVKKIAKNSKDIESRASAIALLIHIYNYSNKPKEQKKALLLIYNYKYKIYSQFYRIMASFGYYQIIKSDLGDLTHLRHFYLGPQTDGNEKQIYFRKIQSFRSNLKDKNKRKIYIQSFKRIISLYLATTNISKGEKSLFEDYVYQFCLIYKHYKEYKEMQKLIERVCKIHGWYSQRLIALWAEAMYLSGKKKQALRKLEYYKDKLPLPVDILRMLARIYLKKRQYKKVSKLYIRQYTISPDDPIALPVIGHYLCDIKRYDTALEVFMEYYHHYDRSNIKHYIGIARVLIAKGMLKEAITKLKKAVKIDYLQEEDIKYPEFKVLKSLKIYRRLQKQAKYYSR